MANPYDLSNSGGLKRLAEMEQARLMRIGAHYARAEAHKYDVNSKSSREQLNYANELEKKADDLQNKR